jgi:hypothetical protein
MGNVGRIRALADALVKTAARRLAGRLQAPAVHVVDPAVIAAPDAALERDPELERGPAVRAVQVEHPHPPAPIAEDDEILTEDPHA